MKAGFFRDVIIRPIRDWVKSYVADYVSSHSSSEQVLEIEVNEVFGANPSLQGRGFNLDELVTPGMYKAKLYQSDTEIGEIPFFVFYPQELLEDNDVPVVQIFYIGPFLYMRITSKSEDSGWYNWRSIDCIDDTRLSSLEYNLNVLTDRVASLESATSSEDLENRVAQIEQDYVSSTTLEERILALEGSLPGDTSLEDRLVAIETQLGEMQNQLDQLTGNE